MFQMRATAAGKPRYGDKSPPYVMRLPLLAEAFPEGRFIHLVRDGRDVALAFMDADFGPESAAHLALHWRLRVERGRQAGTPWVPSATWKCTTKSSSPGRSRCMRTICDFVDLEYDDAMLGYQKRVDEIVQFDPEPWNHRNLEKPPDGRLARLAHPDETARRGAVRTSRRADAAANSTTRHPTSPRRRAIATTRPRR